MTHQLLVVLAQADGAGGADAERSRSLLEFVTNGGIIGYVIIGLSLVALAFVVMHVLQIRRSALAPPEIVEQLDQLLSRGRVAEASRFCEEPANACFLTRVVHSGLSRYRRSPFGALELKGALEEAGQAQVARLYRSTDALALVAGIAPMLGLLGTVVGINGAFAAMNTAEGFARPDQLAGDISLALVTTIMGLSLAIPTTAIVTYFRNRIDAIASEVGDVIDELAMHIEQPGQPRQPASGVARPATASAAAGNAGRPVNAGIGNVEGAGAAGGAARSRPATPGSN